MAIEGFIETYDQNWSYARAVEDANIFITALSRLDWDINDDKPNVEEMGNTIRAVEIALFTDLELTLRNLVEGPKNG
jgi:hypothetical protein